MRIRPLIPLTLITGLVIGSLTLPTLSQEAPTTPPPGSAERKAILDAMRAQGDLHNRIFIVRYLKVQRGWAWLSADPQSPDGKSHYETESALLERDGPGWKVVDQPCAEEGRDDKAEIGRIRAAYPNAPANISLNNRHQCIIGTQIHGICRKAPPEASLLLVMSLIRSIV